MHDEINKIKERYKRRSILTPNTIYHPLSPNVVMAQAEKKIALMRLFRKIKIESLSDKQILEIGCGSGLNLLQLICLGAHANNIYANELLEDRLVQAKKNLPADVTILPGDASELNLPSKSFDIVYQSTVFTSILDDDFMQKLADKLWGFVKPGGGILWYDFVYNNPGNCDVQGIPLKRIKTLFPDAYKIDHLHITLLPLIGRKVTGIYPRLYTLINSVPFLQTHILCWVAKTN